MGWTPGDLVGLPTRHRRAAADHLPPKTHDRGQLQAMSTKSCDLPLPVPNCRHGESAMTATRLLTILLGIAMCSTFQPAVGYDRGGKHPHQGRSVVMAKHGMVATSHPHAAQAGLDILKAGGNAADAAIAVNAMLGVVEPMSCGIGGDVFVIYWDAKTQKLYGLNGSGRSPYALNRQVFKEKGLAQIPL